MLTAHGCRAEVVAAALLHDTLEDTSLPAGQIEADCGPEVLRLVQWCTEDKTKSWEERKQATIRKMEQPGPLEAKWITCADKCANLRSMAADHQQIEDRLWQRFSRGREQQAWYYRQLTRAIAQLPDCPMVRETLAWTQELFGAV